MQQVDYYAKRLEETKVVTFDFSAFAAALPGGVTVDYHLHADPGIDIAQSISGSVITLTITGGGTVGRHYVFGIEAEASNGTASIDYRRMRIREAAPDGITESGVVTTEGLLLPLENDSTETLTDDANVPLYVL